MTTQNIEVIVDQTSVEVVQVPANQVTVQNFGSATTLEVATGGLQGAIGPPSSLAVGTTTTGAAGTNASLTITGTAPSQTVNFTIPRGNTGVAGPANTLTLGTVTTLLPAAAPTVSITGTSPTQTIAFGLPASAEWLSGAVAPATGTGVVGDWYINTANSDYYEKTAAAVWTLRGNLKGLTGNTGPANTLSVAGVTTGAEGSNATVTVGGTSPNQTLTFAIPRGNTGPANTLSLGTTVTGAPGSTASASITGTAPNQTLTLTIPRGDVGATGPANTLSIGTVSTVAVGGSATASVTGTAPNQTLNIGLPTGATGATGLAGSRWYQGNGVPATGTGVLNDYYLNTSTTSGTGDVYQKTGASTWTLIGNIRGVPGAGNIVTVNGDAGPNVVISYASLGVIPTSSLPPLAINEWFVAADQAAMLALTAQRGDMVKRTDTGQVFFLASDSPSTLADWKEVSDNAPVTSVAGRIGDIVLTKTDVGLANVDNTTDLLKPISTATQNALNLKANLASPTFTGTVSGITATMVGLGNVPNLDMRNISNVTSGILPEAQVPLRLGVNAVTVTDWNLALENGFYKAANTAANTPSNAAHMGRVEKADGHITQTIFAYGIDHAGDTYLSRRSSADNGGTWQGWYTLYVSEAELDARYSLGTHNHDSSYVGLTGAQTIAGIKTFSSSPAVPDNSWTISDTAGLQAALDAKSVDTTVVHLAGNETITGIKTFTTAPIITLGSNNFKFSGGPSLNTPSISLGKSDGKSIALLGGSTGGAVMFDDSGAFYITKDTKANIDAGTSTGGAVVVTLTAAGNLSTTGTITGTALTATTGTFTGQVQANGGGQALVVKTNGVTDLAYIGFYPRASAPTVRGSYIGHAVGASDTLHLVNEKTDADISMVTSGTGMVMMNSDLQLSGSKVLKFSATGIAAPTFTTRSGGTKIVLYDSGVSGTLVDYAIGVESNASWQSIRAATSTYSFKWYGGTTNIATLAGTGNFSTMGTLTGSGGFFTPWAEFGNIGGGAATPFIDFHSGATFVDYDSRIIASGGNGTVGDGTLQIISSLLNIDARTSVHSPDTNGGVFHIKAGVANHAYMGIYARDNITRSAWLGYGNTGSTTLTLNNELAGGSLALVTNNGAVTVATGTQNFNITGNAVTSSAPVYITSTGSGITLQSVSPQLQFQDTDVTGAGKNYWLHVNAGQFYILRDGDGDGNWESTYPFLIGSTGAVSINSGSLPISLTGSAVSVYGSLNSTSRASFRYDVAGTDLSQTAIEARNDNTSGYPSIGFHRGGAFAPQLRAITGTEFQFVNQAGTLLVGLSADFVRPAATTNSVNMQRIIFTVASQARPTGTAYVEWVGPVAPTNAINGDTWVSTA